MNLLDQLEENISLTLENYELLQLEAEELREEVKRLTAEKTTLLDNQAQWESKVKSLLSVFSESQGSVESNEDFEEDAETVVEESDDIVSEDDQEDFQQAVSS